MQIHEIRRKNKVGVAFGGGGAKAFAHIGVIHVLKEYGIPIDCLATCSAGSLMGSLIAMEIPTDIIKSKFAEILKRLSWFRPTVSKKAILSQRNFRNIVVDLCGDIDLNSTKIPIKMVATNLGTGELKVFHEGSMKDIVVASSAFPGIYKPVMFDGEYFVDGGLLDSIPADVCRKQLGENGLVIAVSLDGQLSPRVENTHIFGIMYRSLYIPLIHNRERTIQEYADVTIKVFRHHEFTFKNWKEIFRFYDAVKVEEFIRLGEEATRESIPQILKMLGRESEFELYQEKAQ